MRVSKKVKEEKGKTKAHDKGEVKKGKSITRKKPPGRAAGLRPSWYFFLNSYG